MSVRQSLLAILDRGACYGSQLRAEYERRTGAAVNVGQVYTTLERLERDGLVEGAGVDDEARVLWRPTDGGRLEARRGWRRVARGGARRRRPQDRPRRDPPRADVEAVLSAQRVAVRAALAATDVEDDPGDAVAVAIVRAARRARLEADLRWLDEVERLTAGAEPFDLAVERPRRGRPARSAL